MDQSDWAATASRLLQQYPADLQAQVTLACYQGRIGQSQEFVGTLDRVLEALSQASSLDAEDRIRLVLVLTAARQMDLAREHLRGAVAQLDEPTLRRLTAGTLRDLRMLMATHGIGFPNDHLRQLAETLYPPMLRNAK